MYLLHPGLTHGHKLWGAPVSPLAQPLLLWCVPSPAWTYFLATILSELWHRQNPCLGPFKKNPLWSGTITATGVSECPFLSWTRPQAMFSLPWIHSGSPECPVKQHRSSSDSLAICQGRHIPAAVIRAFPAQSDEEQSSNTMRSGRKEQPSTSTGLKQTPGQTQGLPINSWTVKTALNSDQHVPVKPGVVLNPSSSTLGATQPLTHSALVGKRVKVGKKVRKVYFFSLW